MCTKPTEKTIVTAGMPPHGRQSRFGSLCDVLVDIRDKVAALKKQGRSLPEVLEAKPGARYDAGWDNLFQNPSDFAALVYLGV